MGFLVLGDTLKHSAIARTCAGHGWDCSLRHASGRPWIVHAPGPRAPETVISVGRRRLVALGAVLPSDESALERGLAQAAGTQELVALRQHLAGDFHLLFSTEHGTAQAGTIARTRRLCNAQLNGAMVFSDSAALLAELGGFTVDEQLLVAWTLTSYPPHPLDDLPLWLGVDAVPPGQMAVLDREGLLSHQTYWAPPEPEVDDMDHAARMVRDALSDAVEARVRSFSSVSADLSGGLDSTSLAFLLDRHAQGFETFHSLSDDGLNDDARWAAIAADRLLGSRHRAFAYDASPAWYSPVEDRGYSRDTPDPMARTHAKTRFLHLQSAGDAPHARLNGTGGDELFSMDVLAMHDFLHRHPSAAKKPFEEFVYERHDVPRAVRRLMQKDPYREILFEDWFADLGSTITQERRPWPLGWETTPRLAPWASAAAVSQLRSLFMDGRREPNHMSPISLRKPQHEILKLVRIGGDVTRRMSTLSAEHGVFVESPFLDERVVDAALRAAPSLHIKAGRYKPLLTSAMRGILPPDFIERRSKGGYNRELYHGLEQNRAVLLGLFGEDSRLAQRGLIDRRSVVDVLGGLPTKVSTFMMLDSTIGVELWLRDIEQPRYPLLQKELTA